MNVRAIDIVRRVAPRARPEYLASIEAGDAAAVEIGGLATAARMDALLAHILHETDGLTIRVENLNYSAARLPQVWPSRFSDPEVARAHAKQPQKLANFVYGGRMGNVGADDGWRFIGRGLLQITGREAYEKYGRVLGISLAANPDLAFSAEWSWKIALAEWAASSRKGRTCNEMADAGDFEGTTIAVNGGKTGLGSRLDWLRKVRAARAALEGTSKPLTQSRTMGAVGLASLGEVTRQGGDNIGDGINAVAEQLAPAAAVSETVASVVGIIKAVGAVAVACGLAWAAYARWDDAGRPLPSFAPDWFARFVGGHKAEG